VHTVIVRNVGISKKSNHCLRAKLRCRVILSARNKAHEEGDILFSISTMTWRAQTGFRLLLGPQKEVHLVAIAVLLGSAAVFVVALVFYLLHLSVEIDHEEACEDDSDHLEGLPLGKVV